MIDDFFTDLEELEYSFENVDDPTYQCKIKHLQGAFGELFPIQTNLF